MAFETTSTPGGKSLGTEDNSREVIPAALIESSMTNIFVPVLAERGRTTTTLCTTSMDILYGARTFEKNSPFNHHSNQLATALAGLSIPLHVKRFVPDNATKAVLRISAEVIATDLPNIERSSDGSYKQVVDPNTGIGTPIINGTIAGTRVIIRVGVKSYATANREFAMGNIMDDFRDGSLTVAGKFLGELTRADGSKEHPKSRLFPIMDLEIDSEGEWGNNVGLVLSTPYLNQPQPAVVADAVVNRAFPLRVGVVERKDRFSTPNPVPKLDGDLVQDVFLKPKAIESVGGKNRYISRRLIETFNRKNTATETPIWGPYGRVHVYDKNVNEIQTMLASGYAYTDTNGNDIQILGESAYDEEAMDYGRNSDQGFENPLNAGYLNFLTGRDLNNVAYFTCNLSDSLLFGGVSINDSTVLYAEGGNDGLWYLADGSPADIANLKILDDQFRSFLTNFGAGTDKLKDILRYPITGFIDSGWSVETKLAHSKILSSRPDITLVIGSQSVAEKGVVPVDIGPIYSNQVGDLSASLSSELLDGWSYQEKLTPEQDEAVTVRLKTHFGLTPESVFFGTPVMRVMIFGHAGTEPNERYDHPLPGSYDRGLAMAEFTGVRAWDKAVDFSENDNRKPRFLKDMTYVYRDEAEADNAWDAGLNFLRSHDIVDNFWPAVQSIYPYKDSVLNNGKFVLAASKCHYFGMEVWRSVSGENKTDLQFKQDLEEEAMRLVNGRFTDDVRIAVEAVLTDADKARGYSGYLKFYIGIGKPRTKLVYSVHGYSMERFNEMQGLPEI